MLTPGNDNELDDEYYGDGSYEYVFLSLKELFEDPPRDPLNRPLYLCVAKLNFHFEKEEIINGIVVMVSYPTGEYRYAAKVVYWNDEWDWISMHQGHDEAMATVQAVAAKYDIPVFL